MYVRYKKNIQENDLPRKRVRKASKIAGSGGHYLEIRYPERGRKLFSSHFALMRLEFGNKIPREGTETEYLKPSRHKKLKFGNKIPREGTETQCQMVKKSKYFLFGNKIPREGTETTGRIF